MYKKTGGKLKRIHELVEARMARLASTRGRLEYIDGLSFALATPLSLGGSVGGGSIDPPPPTIGEITFYPLTIPNNGTETLDLAPADEAGAVWVHGTFDRGSKNGWFKSVAHHDGVTGVHNMVDEGGDSGNFNNASFAAAVAGDVLTLTFAADNSGDPIVCMLGITRVPRPS